MSQKARALWGFQHNADAVREGDRFELDDETFGKLKASGLVVEDDGGSTGQGDNSSRDGSSSSIDLDGMTVDELREFAKAQDIDLGTAKKKDELQAAIRAGLAAKTE